MRPSTRLVRFDACPGDPWKPTATPIYQTATFAQDSATEFGAYDYSRSGNPTRAVLEQQLAALEHGERGLAFASGMAALAALVRLVPTGGHIVAGDDLYGGTHRLLTRVASRAGVRTSFADVTDCAAIERAIEPRTAWVLVETPTNPLQKVADLRELARVVHERGAKLAVDNSCLSPLLQRPLELGADLVVHSATKHLCGHGDVSAGAVVAREAALGSELAFLQNAEGTGLGPFDSYLLLRGMKTLDVRLARAQANAAEVAVWLAKQPGVRRVHYVGLAEHPQRALHESQASGAGSLISFETGSFERSRRIVESLRRFTIAVSCGNVASSVSLPCAMSHGSIPAAERTLPTDLVRLSIGIEDVRDLLEDLDRAIETAPDSEQAPPALVAEPQRRRART